MIQLILSNGYIPLIPILLWNLVLTSKLPSPYNTDDFDKNISKIVILLEQGFRLIIFLFPLVIRLEIQTGIGTAGLILYIVGSLTYYISWLLLILMPKKVCKNALLFVAPAFTPLLWLTGIVMMSDSFYFNIFYSKLFYLGPVILFTILHTYHTFHAWRKQ